MFDERPARVPKDQIEEASTMQKKDSSGHAVAARVSLVFSHPSLGEHYLPLVS